MPAYLDQDPVNNLIIGNTQPCAAALTSASNIPGTGVDFIANDGLICACMNVGVANAATVATVSYLESSDNVTFTAVAGSTATVLLGTTNNFSQFSAAFQRTKRYVRADILLTGSTKSIFISISLFGEKKSI